MESETTYNLLTVLAYLFMWTTFYFLLCLWNPRRSYEWHCRIVTVIHAIIISGLAFYGVFVLGPWPWSEAGGPNTPHQVRTSTLCLGYFLFDVMWCLYHRTEGPVMLMHHSLSIVGLTWSITSGKYGTELLATIAGAEVTNPLLQLRWFIKETGYYHSVWGDVVDWTFVLSFTFFRIILGSSLLYCYFLQPTDFLGRLGGVLIYTIGWAFFINIIQFGIRKHTKRYADRTEHDNSESVDSTTRHDQGQEETSSISNGVSGHRRIPVSVTNGTAHQSVSVENGEDGLTHRAKH